jgi:hypothetical protein
MRKEYYLLNGYGFNFSIEQFPEILTYIMYDAEELSYGISRRVSLSRLQGKGAIYGFI